MKIAVTGAYGQLGGELCRQLGADAVPLDIDTLDLTQRSGRRRCDAFAQAGCNHQLCGPTRKWIRPKRTPTAAAPSTQLTVEHLANACGRLDCPLVQISTDYVFGAARCRASSLA